MLIADEYVFFSKSDYYDYVLLLHDQELANHRANYSSVVSNLPSKTPLETPDLNHKKTRRRHYFSFFAVNAPAIKHFQNMAADPSHRSYALYRDEELAKYVFSEIEKETGKNTRQDS
jgi:hypothetical protein